MRRSDKIEKNIFVRNIEKKETIVTEVDLSIDVREFKKELIQFWYPSTNSEHSLYYQGIELEEGEPLSSYDIEDHFLLTFAPDPYMRSLLPEERNDLGGKKSISISKRWLEDNIGVDPKELILTDFSCVDHEEIKKIKFETRKERSVFRLTLSEDKVVDYDHGDLCQRRRSQKGGLE